MNAIHVFADKYKYSDRKEYKKEWELWLNNNNDIVEKEIVRIQLLGYKGNIKEKMFVSGRYYYRKYEKKKANKDIVVKDISSQDFDILEKEKDKDLDNEDREKLKKTRDYIKVSKDLLDFIDKYISDNIQTIADVKPCKSYSQFYKINEEFLNTYFTIMENIYHNKNDYFEKIKKTYKNRYYMYKKNNKE